MAHKSLKAHIKVQWNQVERTAQNQVQWKAPVETICSGLSEEDRVSQLSHRNDYE